MNENPEILDRKSSIFGSKSAMSKPEESSSEDENALGKSHNLVAILGCAGKALNGYEED